MLETHLEDGFPCLVNQWTRTRDVWDEIFNAALQVNPAFNIFDMQPTTWDVLPNVIEKSKRSVIVHGLGDFILIAEA
ncbi:hypothetical protein BJV74DRAFT_556937 [Russula compacta]|nr:hypothetical protein BJV74DRAFT_556937 [Russula compacta]